MRWLPCGDVADALLDAVERTLICDLFDELGPEAPTLLAPWTTRDLAAHLVLREHDRLAAPGLVLPGVWSRFAERRRKALALNDFSALVATIRSGPPPASSADNGCGSTPTSTSSSSITKTYAVPMVVALATTNGSWMRPCGATSPRRVGSSPAGCAAPGSRFGGQQPRRPSAPDRGDRLPASQDRRASCCSTCSDAEKQRRSTSTEPPQPSTRCAGHGSACSRNRHMRDGRRSPPHPHRCAVLSTP